MAQKRTKYNVDKDVNGRTYKGIVFASALEMRYFKDVVEDGVASGEIVSYELQKPYELQPSFRKDGKLVRAITYVADFFIQYRDGSHLVVDTKGYADSVALMKRKMFWYKYPDVNYVWLTYVKKYGGWITYEQCKSFRRAARAERKKAAKEIEREKKDEER